jgi:ferredoxin
LLDKGEFVITGEGGIISEQPEKQYKVIFNPDKKEILAPEGKTLLEASRLAEVHLNASCNGNGSCGKCKLIIESGDVETHTSSLFSEKEKQEKYILACMSKVIDNI